MRQGYPKKARIVILADALGRTKFLSASQYRLRLIREGLIEATRHGRVGFVSPTMRDYLREHADEVAREAAGPRLIARTAARHAGNRRGERPNSQ